MPIASRATGTSVRLTDRCGGQAFDVSAGAVINAAGVWAGEIDGALRLRPSRGTHLVFDAQAFGNPTAALTIPIPGELNRFVEQIPFDQDVKIYYMTQASVRPPTFVAFTDKGRNMHFSTERYIMNQLRKRFGFAATPIVLKTKRR